MRRDLIAGSIALVLMTWALGCSGPGNRRESGASGAELKSVMDSISAGDLLHHTAVLSSDAFEGRAPGTRGEARTVGYLVEQFQKLGLKPGNPDGTFIQKVPLVGVTSRPKGVFVSRGGKLELRFPEDSVAVSRHLDPTVTVSGSDMVFVGYGVVAPEYDWDDYKDADLKGKTLVMLINDPAIPDPKDPSKLDETTFKGKAMTYYGRWTYKYEIASEKGAAAAIIVHETGPAGYPYEVVAGSWGRENFDIRTTAGNPGRVLVESWITSDAADRLFRMSGHNLASLKKAAADRNFRPVPLGARASFTLQNSTREIESTNVVAKVDGSDPRLRDEWVIYSAHWDHLGRDDKLKGDQIYNGALDNASGTAGLLELAQAFARIHPAPRRSTLFLAVTSEEQGLLGAKYYAERPLYPLARTVADINMDGVNVWGRTRDIVVIGMGNSTLDDLLRETAATQGRVLKPDPEPEKGFFYRSDHFEFAKQGVPALYVEAGTDFEGKDPNYGLRMREEYTRRDYHKVTDEVKPDWDLSGAVEDLRLLFLTGYRLAQDDKMPEWKPGAEFKARREEMLRKP